MTTINLGTDLNLVPYFQAQDAATIDLTTAIRHEPGAGGIHTGLATLSNRQNLAQALILRLLTPRGSLRDLGHAAYGSRLHELIGKPKDNATRGLCRVFALEAVAQEPRVEDKAVKFQFDIQSETPSSMVFLLEVQPRDGGVPLPISLEISL